VAPARLAGPQAAGTLLQDAHHPLGCDRDIGGRGASPQDLTGAEQRDLADLALGDPRIALRREADDRPVDAARLGQPGDPQPGTVAHTLGNLDSADPKRDFHGRSSPETVATGREPVAMGMGLCG
jgi:hypothetical protein